MSLVGAEANRKWDVREGLAGELSLELKDNRTEYLAFVAHGEDAETRRKKFDVLKQVAELLHELVKDQRHRKLEALVEALMPDVQFSPTKIVEAKMLSAARTAVLESQDFVPASAIADIAQFSSKNPSSQPNRWKRHGQMFAVPHKGTDLYPLYALDRRHGFRPLPVVGKVLSIFLGKKTGWETAFWFESVNSYLNNKRPKDLLETRPEAVLSAAQAEADGLQHG